MEKTMVKQSTPPPQNPPPPPDHLRPVNWNAPVTRGEFQQGIGALEKNLRQDINALDKRLTVVETKIDVLDEKVEEVKADVKDLKTKIDENSGALRAEIKENSDALRAEIKKNSDTQRTERREELRDLKADIMRYFRILGIYITGLVTLAVTVALALPG